MKKIIFLFASLFFLNSINAQTTLEEGFESWPPEGWQILELGDGLNGWRDDFSGIYHSGEQSAHSHIDNNQCDNWLVAPPIEVTSNNYELKFWDYHKGIEYYDKASVQISTGSGNPTDGDFIEIYTTSTPLNLETWEERTIDLSSYNGENIYVAFRYEGTWHSWNLDDVTISPDTYTDGALTEYLSPIGVSETPVTSPVIVKLENLGTSVINDFNITWEVNSIPQTPYSGSGLNLQPGQSSNIDLGVYNFDVVGFYNIEATLDVTNDFDSSNNIIATVFEIASEKDGAIIGITPEGMIPNEGNIDVNVLVTNLGINTIDVAEILWSIDEMDQTPFSAANLNLVPGETRSITIGQGNFVSGVHTINTTFNVLGDINDENDNYQGSVAVNTFWESFEGSVFPPENWSINFGVLDNSNFGDPVQGDKFYSAFADDNMFGVVTDTIYSPRLEITNGDTYSFYLKRNSFFPLTHTVVWKDGITGEVNVLETVQSTPNENWTLITVNISAAQGANYIGVSSASGSYGHSRFDLFTSTAKLHLYDNDMAVKNGDIYYLAKDNVAESYTCTIKNEGALSVLGSNYTVKLMEAPGVQLASVSGVNLNSWEESEITINHTFTGIESHRLYFEVEFAADENMNNNTFREASVHVVPNTVILDEMGEDTHEDLNFPFDGAGDTMSLGEDDISQTLYLNSDFENPGTIYGFVYTYNNIFEMDRVQELPLKVWISQTQTTELSGGYLPYNELTLVFDGIIEILPGANRDVYIPFDQPVAYTGMDNIVIQDYQYNPGWPPSLLRFHATDLSSDNTRTIRNFNVYDLDPENPPIEFYAVEDIAYTRFVIDPTVNYSALSGTVYNTSNDPLSDATVVIDNTSISVQTDSNGIYSFPDIAYGTYDVTASKFGYNDFTSNLTLDAPTFEYDFHLTERAQVEVTGTVYGSNNVSIPLEFVQVTIEGYISDNTATDSDGDFLFSGIYGNSDYEVTFSLYGYYDTTSIISVLDQSIGMGDIILEQEFISPFDVEVITDTDATINWNNPLESTKVKLQNDLDEISHSYTNEPFENVWLGNIMSISEITTLTSVEVRTDIYQLTEDYVTIDVFDVATEEIIATSEPFIIYANKTHTVDIPNIVVYDDIAVMVHWQNNADYTNALAVDYSDSSIENSAVIKYPGEPFVLMSDFVGIPPNSSFLVRTNTLDVGNPDTNNEILTYNVYRGLANEFPNITNWETLNTSPITGNTFEDLDWSSTDPLEQYRFAVEAIYTEGNSEVTFSNVVDSAILGNSDFELMNTNIAVYPVPTSDQITISLGLDMQTSEPILAYDTLGRKVLEISPSEIENGRVTKSTNHLQSGMYFLKINIDGIFINKKFIVN